MRGSQQEIKKQLQNLVNIIDPWLAYQRYVYDFPSIAVGVVHGHKTVFAKAYGHADLGKKIKAAPFTTYRIASNSKVFTAIAIMKLEQRRSLKISDSVSKHLSWFRSAKDPRLSKITIKDLLTNSSGLIREGHTEQWVNDKFATEKEIRGWVHKGILSSSKKGKFKYSNLGFAILGLIIEKASGMSYAEYTRKILNKPLGLRYTDAQLTPAIKSKLARGYGGKYPEQKKREIFPDPETNAMEAATGYSSNVLDLLKAEQVQFFGNNKILPDQIKRRMMQKIVRNAKSEKEWTGLGYEIWQVGDRDIVGHGGGFQGFKTITGFDPKAQVGVVALINTIAASPRRFADEIFKTLDYLLEHSKDFGSADRKLAKYAGYYRWRWGDTLIIPVGKKLIAVDPSSSPAGSIAVLNPVGKDQFEIQTHGIDNTGELAQFVFKPENKRPTLYWGSAPNEPLDLPEVSTRKK